MNPNIQRPPSKEVNSRNRDTGFPEPLSHDRNTTLPHPDADTSPNATMEAPDLNLVRTRSRRSFLHGRHSHSRKGSKHDSGVSLEKTAGLYDNIQYADGSSEDRSSKEIEKEVNDRDDLVNAPTNTISIEKRDEQGHLEGEGKKGLLRKLNLHKV
jgi:hypothetical protein